MSNPCQYVDVLVPLPLPKLLTYSLEGVEEEVVEGMRAVVQVGVRRMYTGLIWKLHNEAPAAYSARPIETLIDVRPVITHPREHCGLGWRSITCAPAVKSWLPHSRPA